MTIKHSEVLTNDTIYAHFNDSDNVCYSQTLGMMDVLEFEYGFLLIPSPMNQEFGGKEGKL